MTGWVVAFAAIMLLIIMLILVFSRFLEISDRLDEFQDQLKRLLFGEEEA